MATLRLVPVSGPAIDVVKDQSMVGREPSCEIVVTDGSVSRRHARLEKRGAAWWVVDQGSANGTYVNSLKVAEQALKNNQELRFGALAFRVDLREDPEATVSAPIPKDDSATVMVPQSPPPISPPPIPPTPAAPPPLPHAAATPPPTPPSAAAARERFRPTGPTSPVPQMPAGAPPGKKGKSPIFWIGGGCCGCLLLIAAIIGLITAGLWVSTTGARDAARAWVDHLRTHDLPAARAGMTMANQNAVSDEQLAAIAVTPATELSFKLSTEASMKMDGDSVALAGTLTDGAERREIEFRLLKEGGQWKIDGVKVDHVALVGEEAAPKP